MNPIVVKFGGSSLATAAQFEKVAAIIREAPARRKGHRSSLPLL